MVGFVPVWRELSFHWSMPMVQFYKAVEQKLTNLERELTAEEGVVLRLVQSDSEAEPLTRDQHTRVYAVWCTLVPPEGRDPREFMSYNEILMGQPTSIGEDRQAAAQCVWVPPIDPAATRETTVGN